MAVTASANRRRFIEQLQLKVDHRASGFMTLPPPTVIQESLPSLGTFPDDNDPQDDLSFGPYSAYSSLSSSYSSYLQSKPEHKQVIQLYLTKKTKQSKILEKKQADWEFENENDQPLPPSPATQLLEFVTSGTDEGDVEMCLVLPRVKRNRDGTLDMPSPPALNSRVTFTMNAEPLRPWQGTVKYVIEHSGREGGKRMVDLVLTGVERIALEPS